LKETAAGGQGASASFFLGYGAAALSVTRTPVAVAQPVVVVHLSGGAAQNYFSDGLTRRDDQLSRPIDPQRMGVIARTTSMAYKGTRKSIREIGAELGVDYVLESSRRCEGSHVRITSQLIRVKDQTHIWASTYDREVTGILSIQQELATGDCRTG
jgi:TolB-like protein